MFDICAETDGENSLTYGEIYQPALGPACQSFNTIDRSAPIGIALPDGATYPVAMLAALAAGCPYVPLDFSFPAEHNVRILENRGMKAVIVDDKARDALGRIKPALPRLHFADAIGEGGPALPQALSDVAAIFYTSGSTGQPKGVQHDQQNLIHHAMLRTNSAHIADDDRILLLFTPIVPVVQQDIFSLP